jgi:hypothetical protein
LTQDAVGQSSHGGHVGGSVAIALAATVFVKPDIQNPVLRVFDAPMFANTTGEYFGLGCVAADVVASFPS